jgi:outer membrane receptor for ferrienterochelin and colicin
MRNRTSGVASCLVTFALIVANAEPRLMAQANRPPSDLTQATLEQLMNIQITTASRTTEAQSDAPARVEVITAEQIRRRGYRSLLDVLKDLPEFKVDLRGNWDFPAELTIQGVRGAGRVVLLFDGIRVSAPTNEPLPIVANYPVHGARQIEIVYGPVSAVYGADAFSAVINVITKDAGETTGLSLDTSVGAFGLYDQTMSYGTRIGRDGGLVVSGQFQHDGQPDLSRYYPDDFHGMQAQRAGVFPTIFGVMTPSQAVSPEYHIPLWAGSLQATYRAGGLQLSAFANRSHLPTTAGVYTPDNVIYGDGAFNENSLFVAAGSYTRRIGSITSTSTGTLSRHQLGSHSGYMDLYSNMNRSYKYAFGSILKGEQNVSFKPASSVTLTAGGTVERFFAIPQTADLNAPIESQATPGTILGTNIVDEFFKLHYTNVGAFAEMRYAMTRRVVLTTGGRLDYNTRYGSTFNPRVGLVVQGAAGTTLKLLYGTAYLAPSPYQQYGHYGSFLTDDGGRTYHSPYWHLPNPELKPEHKKTLEANVLQRLGPNISVSASTFYSRFTNLIQATDVDQAYAGEFHGWPVDYIDFATNEGWETTYGGTFTFKAGRSIGPNRQINAHAGLSVADGRVRPQHETNASLAIGGMAPVQLRLGADVDWDRFSLAPRVAVAGRQRLGATILVGDALERRSLAGYWTCDVTGRRRDVLKHLDAFVTVENAFDRRYRTINERAYVNAEEFIGIPQNPRRLTVGFALRIP